MVNWEDVINGMELPEPNPVQVEGDADVIPSLELALDLSSSTWTLTSEHPGHATVHVDLERIRDREQQLGSERFPTYLKRMTDAAIEQALHRHPASLDNDML